MTSCHGGGGEDGFLRQAGEQGGSGESPGRKKGGEARKNMVCAGNSEQLHMTVESITLRLIGMFCPQVPRRIGSCDRGHLPAMAGWGEMEP